MLSQGSGTMQLLECSLFNADAVADFIVAVVFMPLPFSEFAVDSPLKWAEIRIIKLASTFNCILHDGILRCLNAQWDGCDPLPTCSQ